MASAAKIGMASNMAASLKYSKAASVITASKWRRNNEIRKAAAKKRHQINEKKKHREMSIWRHQINGGYGRKMKNMSIS